jgi:predicted N-acetyltransferase YhbS
MNKLRIEHLKDHPDHLQTIATWIYNEWWMDKPDVSVQSMKERLSEAATESEIPLSFIAFIDNDPVGTVNFIESDNSEFPNLSPWLAALLVHPKYRGKGIGAALVKECTLYAQKLGVKEFYLGTDIPQFYEPLGAELYAVGSEKLQIMKIKPDTHFDLET